MRDVGDDGGVPEPTPAPASAAAGTPAGASPTAPARSRYAMGSSANMFRSLLVVLVLVAGLVMIVPRVTEVRQPPVNAAAVAAMAVKESGQSFLAPVALPDGWVATQARYGPWTDLTRTWQAGWTTPGGGFVAIKQAVQPSEAWLKAATAVGKADGTVQLGGRSWDKRVDERNQIHLIARDPAGLTTVVSSVKGMADLQVFVPALVPAKAAT